MKRYLAILAAITVCLFFSQLVSANDECDNPDAQELTRIYFGNGMFNSDEAIQNSADALKALIGASPDYDYGIAENPSEPVLLQLLNVYNDKKNDSSFFWNWLTYLDDADAWFQDAYLESVRNFTESSIDDTYLFLQVNQYERDLQSGKKVVIVSHSQGNFYANNAYSFIVSRNPDYQSSIGIVGVATPASYVAGSNLYATRTEDVFYTTNESDAVMDFVRVTNVGTLPPNPTAPFDGPADWFNHKFINTYINGFGGRIKNQVLQTISRLQPPNKKFECKSPSEVPVVVNTTQATNITTTSARLHGYVVSGKQIAGHCIWRRADSGNPATCLSYLDRIATSGPFDTGESFYCTATGLSPGTNYRFRVCGREGSRYSDGGIQSFTTVPEIQCDSAYSASGSSEGMNVDYNMGTTKGLAEVQFTTYTIPDKLEIWHGGNLIYTTNGYISTGSTPLTTKICHEPNNGSTWNIKVYGNPDTGTAWNISIGCPKVESVFQICQ